MIFLMMKTNFYVVDTSSLISASLIKSSINALVLDTIFIIGKLAISKNTFLEFSEVLYRPKFDKYLTDTRRKSVLGRIEQDAVLFNPDIKIHDCRDPKDNKFLELALISNASCIVSGDQDLLILHPFRNIPILKASDFMKKFHKKF